MEKYVKAVWIKFGSQEEYSENEERLFSLLEKAPGDSIVKVYDASAERCKKLSGCSFDETQISILKDAFGEENVRNQEKTITIKEDWGHKESFEALLIRIADALEDISESMKR